MQKHFLLLLFSEQGGADCGGPLSAAAQTHRICPELMNDPALRWRDKVKMFLHVMVKNMGSQF